MMFTGDSVARVCMVPDEVLPARVNQNVAILRTDNERLYPDFLKYHLLNPVFKRHLLSIASTGGTRNALTKGMLESLELYIPVLPEQKAIAEILSSFDDKIELLREQNKILETTAQTIFKEWFVNFNFSGATGEMIESELGKIPKGWRVNELGKVASLSAGGDKPKNATKNKTISNKIPIYSNGITNEGLYGFSDTPTILEESVTVSARGTIGYVCLRFKPYIPIVRLISIIPVHKYLSSKYLFFWLKNQNISGFETTQQQLTIPVFKKTKIIIPHSNLMYKYTKEVDSFYDKIQNNNAQIQTLSINKDTLLPKLMSGEERVG